LRGYIGTISREDEHCSNIWYKYLNNVMHWSRIVGMGEIREINVELRKMDF